MGAERRRLAVLAAALLTPAWASACAGSGAGAPSPDPAGEVAPAPLPAAAALDADARRWVDETLASLSLRQTVAQLVMPWIPGGYASTSDPGFRALERWVAEVGVGGVYVSIGTPHAYAAKLNELQARAALPLLVASDFEDGGPGMRLGGVYALPSLLGQGGGTAFPSTMAFGAVGDEAWAYRYGLVTGREARAVGVHMDFAPVLDVNSDPANPVIGVRSFGEDPEAVARLGAAFVRGLRDAGVLSTAKHFPGHGDTDVDSHTALPTIGATPESLRSVELVPFRAAVEAGVDAVMSAHIVAPGVRGVDSRPATLDPWFLEELLRGELGFDGIVVTDALTMAAVSERWPDAEAAVLALEAGADLLLMPADPAATVDGVVAAVEAGRLTPERVRRSARRILEAKARVGLHRDRSVDLDAVDERVGTGEHLAFADSVATRSLTLLRDDRGAVPLRPGARVLSVTYAPPRDLAAGRALDRGLAAAGYAVRSLRVEPGAPPAAWAEAETAAQEVDVVVVGVHLPAPPPPAAPGDRPGLRAFGERVRELRPTVHVAFGTPYLTEALGHVDALLLAWSGREVAERAVARALAGEAALTGTTPVRVGDHPVGAGIRRDAGAPAVLPPARGLPPGRFRLAPAPRGPSMTYSLVEVEPASVGMSEAVLDSLDALVLAAIADSASPGAALAVGRHGRLVRLRGYGYTDWEGDRRVSAATIYDLASLTKVVATTTAVMALVDEGRLSLDDRVVEHLPWWSAGDPRKDEVTLRQLLLHRAGLPPFRRWFFEIEGEEAYRNAIGAEPLEYAPGTRTVYSDIGFMTLGFVVEAVTGRRLDAFADARIFDRLGMHDTGFLPDPERLPRIAPTEVDTIWRHEHVHGTVHDENADALGGVAGHAGLFSTAWDLAVFAGMMAGGGAVGPCEPEVGTGVPCTELRPDSVRIASPATVERFTDRWDATASRALGWDTPEGRSSAGDWFTADAFGHTGFTGTSIWVDPELDLWVVLLTNRVDPTRDNARHVPLRRAVHDLAARAITDRPVSRREP